MTIDRIWGTYLEMFLHLQQVEKKKILNIRHPEIMYSTTRDDCKIWKLRNLQKDNFFWVKLFTPYAFINYYQKKNGSSELILDCFNTKNKNNEAKNGISPHTCSSLSFSLVLLLYTLAEVASWDGMAEIWCSGMFIPASCLIFLFTEESLQW